MNPVQKFINFIRRSPLETGAALLTLVAVVVSVYAFAATQAAGPFAYADAAQATVANGAQVVNDTSAVGGKALQFAAATPTPPPPTSSTDLNDPKKKEMAMQLVSAAENSSLDWKAQYAYIEYNVEGNAAENRGYTAGIVGFTSKTSDMLALVKYYKQIAPGNILEKYIPALEKADGTSSQTGLGNAFMNDWKTAANAADGKFRQAQDAERDRVYFNPAVTMSKQDGLRALGQFAYYDAAVMHGPDDWGGGLVNIRAAALKKAKPPAQGGDEKTYLNAFLDARKAEMLREEGHAETGRVDTAQRKFLNENNFDLNPPLTFGPIYSGDPVFTIR